MSKEQERLYVGPAPDLPGAFNVYSTTTHGPVASYFVSYGAARRWVDEQP